MRTDVAFPTTLPVDVSSRIDGLLAIAADVENRVGDLPVLAGLIRDYQEMAREFILRFEADLNGLSAMHPGEKWMKRHEMIDKLAGEWQLIYTLAASMEMGSAYIGRFKPYVDQAVADLGLADAGKDFLLIPIFGEKFALVTVGYSSSNIAILNLPVSVIHSPWEFSVIWHELAGLKVDSLQGRIKAFLEAYASKNGLEIPKSSGVPGSGLLGDLFTRIAKRETVDSHLLAEVREFINNGKLLHREKVEIWSQDWFEQLYEDACSVLAFGEEFVPVLEKILSRQSRKLTADWKHPDLETRIRCANRLLALQQGQSARQVTDADRLTDELLWAFIQENRSDPIAQLPVAFEKKEPLPEIRKKLLEDMKAFNERFGDLKSGTILENGFTFSPMLQFADRAAKTGRRFPSDSERLRVVREKLNKTFPAEASIEDMLAFPFSHVDPLDFETHSVDQIYQTMYIGSSSHGGHYVFHLSHA